MLDTGVIPVLARMLSTERSTTLRNRVLYALSSLLRHFPFAQQTFLQQGGLDALRSVFDKDVGTGKEKLQLKAITLITDLVTEKVGTVFCSESRTLKIAKIESYNKPQVIFGSNQLQ